MKVVVSGTVGPEAMTSSGSAMTSERMSATTLAGCAAAANCPPLTADKCLRTVLSCVIDALAHRRVSDPFKATGQNGAQGSDGQAAKGQDAAASDERHQEDGQYLPGSSHHPGGREFILKRQRLRR